MRTDFWKLLLIGVLIRLGQIHRVFTQSLGLDFMTQMRPLILNFLPTTNSPKECHFSAPKKDATGVQPPLLHVATYQVEFFFICAQKKNWKDNAIEKKMFWMRDMWRKMDYCWHSSFVGTSIGTCNKRPGLDKKKWLTKKLFSVWTSFLIF